VHDPYLTDVRNKLGAEGASITLNLKSSWKATDWKVWNNEVTKVRGIQAIVEMNSFGFWWRPAKCHSWGRIYRKSIVIPKNGLHSWHWQSLAKWNRSASNWTGSWGVKSELASSEAETIRLEGAFCDPEIRYSMERSWLVRPWPSQMRVTIFWSWLLQPEVEWHAFRIIIAWFDHASGSIWIFEMY